MSEQSQFIEHLDSYISNSMAFWQIPGMSVAILKDNQVIFCKGFGVTNLNQPAPVDENTIFAIGSNTKAFTATAIGLLVAKGKLAWDEKVTRYLPDFAMMDETARKEMTVRDLLCHRGGLGTWSGDILSYGSSYSREEVIRRIRFIPPAYSFRAGYGYCNLLFLTAGQIIPVITGQSWDDFITQHFFQPLGMTRSFPGLTSILEQTNVAIPHEKLVNGTQPISHRDIQNHGPAGAIYSTASDLSKWVKLQLNNGLMDGQQLIPLEIIEETRQPNTPIRMDASMRALVPARHFAAYGLGWFMMDYHGRQVVYHTGGVDGMISLVGMVPEEDLGVVILTNKIPHNLINSLFFHVMDGFMGIAAQDWNNVFMKREQELELKEQQKKEETERNRTGKPTSSLLDAYTGTYDCQVYGSAAIKNEAGLLRLHLSAHPNITGTLEHWDGDTFLCRWSDPVFDQSMIPFTLNSHGQPAEFHLSIRPDWIDPLDYVFVKIA